MRRLMTVVALVLAATAAHAQTDPRTLPLVQAGDMVARGTFLVPTGDGAFGFTWSRGLLGIAADGKSLYIACDGDGKAARVSIPTVGAVAQVLDTCKGPSNINAVDPGSEVNGYALGGVLDLGGTVVASAFSYYDGGYDAVKSHWSGPSLSTLTGPVRPASAWNVGWFAGAMGPVPAEWQALLGGAWLTGQHSLSTLPRTSFGPSVSTFDPRNLTGPASVLFGCDEAHQAGCYGNFDAANPVWSGFSKGSGFAAVPGTRSILFALRHGRTYCYGTGAACGDPTNPNQGNHGYPAFHEIVAISLADAADVVAGRKAFHQVKPYASWELPGIGTKDLAQPLTMAFDPATRRAYLMEYPDGRQPVVHVYEITVGSQPPPPPPPPPPAPPTGSLSANPTTVTAGVPATLTWTSTGATTATIDQGIGAVPTAGTRTVTPATTTTYTLTLTGDGGTASASTAVTVTAAPPVDQCAVNPVVLSVTSWPGSAEGGRSGSWSWSVANTVATLADVRWLYTAGRATTLQILDSRGCPGSVSR